MPLVLTPNKEWCEIGGTVTLAATLQFVLVQPYSHKQCQHCSRSHDSPCALCVCGACEHNSTSAIVALLHRGPCLQRTFRIACATPEHHPHQHQPQKLRTTANLSSSSSIAPPTHSFVNDLPAKGASSRNGKASNHKLEDDEAGVGGWPLGEQQRVVAAKHRNGCLAATMS